MSEQAGLVLLIVACTMGASHANAQTPQFVAGPTAVIIEPTIPVTRGGPAGNNLSLVADTLVADFAGTGRADVVIAVGLNPLIPPTKIPLRVLRPGVGGTLADVTRQLFGAGALPAAGAPSQLLAADFNRDGKLDLFVADTGYDGSPPDGGTNILLHAMPNGTFVDRSATLPTIPDYSHSAAVGDVNGDSILDIYVGNIYGSFNVGPYFLVGNPDGTFDQARSTLPGPIRDLMEKFTASFLMDVDNDGVPDLVLGTHHDNGYVDNIVLFNDGKGDFTKRPRYVLPFGPLGAHVVALKIMTIDANDDGFPDLLILGTQGQPTPYVGGSIQLLINQKNGTFVDETAARLGTRATVLTGIGWNRLQVVDINGDGKLDILASGGFGIPGASPSDFLWINNGNGTFTPIPASGLAPAPIGVLVAMDADSDGQLDLVSLDFIVEGHLKYQVYLNKTPRSVPSEPLIEASIAGDTQVAIFFKKPLSSGASTITGYTATCSPGKFSGARTASPISVTGLTNGTLYSCVVTATSAFGTSLPSAAVNARPKAGLNTVLEFYNTNLDNYFITASAGEAAAIDNGSAGPGWSRTGNAFESGGDTAVCRFYGSQAPGPNSHFYTADAGECAYLKHLQASTPASQQRWNFESNDFLTTPAANRTCAAGLVPIYRAYNNGFARNIDSNHRITSSQTAIQEVVNRGWTSEGMVMCAL